MRVCECSSWGCGHGGVQCIFEWCQTSGPCWFNEWSLVEYTHSISVIHNLNASMRCWFVNFSKAQRVVGGGDGIGYRVHRRGAKRMGHKLVTNG